MTEEIPSRPHQITVIAGEVLDIKHNGIDVAWEDESDVEAEYVITFRIRRPKDFIRTTAFRLRPSKEYAAHSICETLDSYVRAEEPIKENDSVAQRER